MYSNIKNKIHFNEEKVSLYYESVDSTQCSIIYFLFIYLFIYGLCDDAVSMPHYTALSGRRLVNTGLGRL
jgi:hypothetical protein